MNYKKGSVGLVVLGAVLLILGFTYARADYCDYCTDDAAIYDGSFDYYDTPSTNEATYEASYEVDQYDYEQNGLAPTEESYNGPVETSGSSNDAYTNSYDPVLDKPEGQTLEEYYYGGDQSSPPEEVPTPDLTTGYTSSLYDESGMYTAQEFPADYVDHPSTDYPSGTTANPASEGLFTPQTTYPVGEINTDTDLSRYYNFSNEPITTINYTNYFNSGGNQAIDYGGLLQMQTRDMSYVAPINYYKDPVTQYLLYGSPSASSIGPASVDFAKYVNYSVVVPEFRGDTESLYTIPGTNIGQTSIGQPGSPTYDYLVNYPSYTNPPSSVSQPDPVIIPTYRGAEIRDQDIKSSLTNIYLTSAKALGIGQIAIVSAGQPSTGNYSASCEQNAAGTIDRCGAHQHDNGNAGDIILYKDGRALNFDNKADRPIVAQFITLSVAQGATGIGAGDSYMGPITIHVGYGNPAGYWGGGVVDPHPAPQWVIDAYDKGMEMRTAYNKEVQQALKDAGYYKGAIDGDIGPQSQAAITAFQKANGLPADGTVSPGTLAALDVIPPGGQLVQVSATSPTQSSVIPHPTLRPGDVSTGDQSNVVTVPIINGVPYPNLRPGDYAVTDQGQIIPLPHLRPGDTTSATQGQTVPLPNLRPGDTTSATQNQIVPPLPHIRPENYFTVTEQGQAIPNPNLRPSAPSTGNAGATPTIPPGPYGAEVLAKAILSGDALAIAAAQAQIEANIGADIVARRANSEGGLYLNLWDLFINSGAEKAAANAQVQAYLDQTLNSGSQTATSPTNTGSNIPIPRLREDLPPGSIPSTESGTANLTEPTRIPAGPYGAQVLAKAILSGDPDKIAAAQKQVHDNASAEIQASCGGRIGCLIGLAVNADAENAKATAAVQAYLTETLPQEAPGAVRQFQQKVQNDPSLIADLPPDQRALLEKAFSNLPPTPKATVQPTQTAPNYTNYSYLNPSPSGPATINFGDYTNSTLIAPEFFENPGQLNNVPGASIGQNATYNYIFHGYPTASYYFSPNTLLNTPDQNPAVSSPPLVHKDFSIDDPATIKNLYVYDPTTETFFFGYQTLDSPASTEQNQSSTSTYYYYIPPTTGGGHPQEIATTIPPYYIGSMVPTVPASRIYNLFNPQNKNNPKYLLNLYLSYRNSHKSQNQTSAPTIEYTSDTGSGFQPQLTWDSSSAGNASSNVVFYVDYSRLLQDQNFSPYTLYDSLGNRIRTGQGRPPSLSLCSDTSTPSVAENCSFNLIPSFLRKDTASKIYWYITNLKQGDNCSITSSPSVMQPQYSTPNKSTWINTSGYQVTISQKTVFTLTCTSSKGITSSVSKTINIVPIIQEI